VQKGIIHEAWIRPHLDNDQNASLQIAELVAEGVKEKYMAVDEVSGLRKPGKGPR
jgi:hypothetical protein